MGAKSKKNNSMLMEKISKVSKIRVFGVLNVFDVTIISIFLIALLVAVVVKGGASNASNPAGQTISPVEVDVLLEEERISRKEQLFKPGEKTFITIRNVPYTKLEIVNSVKIQLPKQEPSYPYGFNILVTVMDNAILTDDGPVIGGNKIKIGLPIMLEGYDYKLSGVVTDVRLKNNAS